MIVSQSLECAATTIVQLNSHLKKVAVCCISVFLRIDFIAYYVPSRKYWGDKIISSPIISPIYRFQSSGMSQTKAIPIPQSVNDVRNFFKKLLLFWCYPIFNGIWNRLLHKIALFSKNFWNSLHLRHFRAVFNSVWYISKIIKEIKDFVISKFPRQ